MQTQITIESYKCEIKDKLQKAEPGTMKKHTISNNIFLAVDRIIETNITNNDVYTKWNSLK